MKIPKIELHGMNAETFQMSCSENISEVLKLDLWEVVLPFLEIGYNPVVISMAIDSWLKNQVRVDGLYYHRIRNVWVYQPDKAMGSMIPAKLEPTSFVTKAA